MAPGLSLSGCGHEDGEAEKNWVAFSRPEAPGTLYFVRTVQPHEVVLARPSDGKCVERGSAWVTSSPAFAALSDAGYAIHGSATASLLPAAAADDETSDPLFVALAHLVDDRGHYVTVAYTFSAAPPFGVVSVSRPLPLQGDGTAFPSAFFFPPHAQKAVLAYGVDNAESRALVMSLMYFSDLFEDK